ncbi:hypothetical protein BGZ65_006454, partial [Modicella reniformis]
MSWAISGTPIRRHIEDLQSLLKFLNQEPIASNKRLWRLLTAFSFRSTFVSSYQRIMHRYAKKDVVQELALPSQIRLCYGIQFTEIERANYDEKWEQCLSECNINIANDDSEEAESLQSWLMRLRQTCCHPQIGSRNKESLGKTNLRTITEVLDVMVQQNNAQLDIKEKAHFATKLKRVVLSARIHKDITEVQVFKHLAVEAQRQAEVWNTKLQEQRSKRRAAQGGSNRYQADADTPANGEYIIDLESLDLAEDRVELNSLRKIRASADDAFTTAMLRHKDWQEHHHRTLFFTACFYHDLEMEVEEVELYKQAEQVRKQALALSEQKFDKLLEVVKSGMHKVKLGENYVIPDPIFTGGIAMNRHLDELKFVTDLLNRQLTVLSRWRQDLVDRLTQPLMQDGEEGEQYQYSIDLQHTLESYLHFYGRMVILRRDLLSGTEETVAKHVAHVQSQNEHAAMVMQRENRIRMFTRKPGKEKQQHPKEKEKEEEVDKRLEREMNELITPDLVSTMRSIRTNIKSVSNDPSLPQAEKQMAEIEDHRLKDEQNQQIKLLSELEKGITVFRTLTAARTVYYRQLQGISDSVQEIESFDPEKDMDACLEEETKLQAEIVRLVSRQRYLEHLAGNTTTTSHGGGAHSGDAGNVCLICRSQYNLGSMTECGHVFCEPCLYEWTKNHSKCPSCNSEISRKRLTRVTMSGVATEPKTDQAESSSSSSSSSSGSKTLSEVSGKEAEHHHGSIMRLVPEAIRRMIIQDGYGSKIDSIVRHIAFLVKEDPETKCLVFSQWTSLLKLVGDSLTMNHIGLVKLDGGSLKTAVRAFKENPDKHVFMLHAKSQSAGLTLLSATHIFICEPLVNPVLQAQAVSRVHRIGQTKEVNQNWRAVKGL